MLSLPALGRSDFVISRTVILCYTVVLHPPRSPGGFQQISHQELWTQWHRSLPAQEGSVINIPLSKWCCLALFTLTFQRSMWREPPDSAEGVRAVRPVITNQSLLLLPEPVAGHRRQTKQWFRSVIGLFLMGENEVFSIVLSFRKYVYCFKHQVAHKRNGSFNSGSYCEHRMLQGRFD